MSTLLYRTVKVAYENPELRPHLLPLIKEAKEKSLLEKVDEKFKDWKGEYKGTGNVIVYSTLKGWTYFSEQERASDEGKQDRYEFAIKQFNEFKKAVEADEKDGGEKDVSISDVFKDGKLDLDPKEPSEEDLKKLAKQVGDTFATEGFQRGAVKQFLDTLVTDEIKRNIKMLYDLGKKLKGKGDELTDDNPEVRGMVKNLATNTALSLGGSLAGWASGKFSMSVGGAASALTTSVMTAFGIGGTVASIAPTVVSLAVGTVFYKKAFHQRLGKKERVSSLANDIYAGYNTPEGVEKEYKGKLDKILGDSKLKPSEAKKQILALHEEFQTSVRPAIDKGLKQLGHEGEGQFSFPSLLKQAKSGDLPTAVILSQLKVFFEAQEAFEADIKKDPKAFFGEVQSVLSGKEKVPDGLSSEFGVNQAKKETSKSASLKKEAVRKMMSRNIRS